MFTIFCCSFLLRFLCPLQDLTSMIYILFANSIIFSIPNSHASSTSSTSTPPLPTAFLHFILSMAFSTSLLRLEGPGVISPQPGPLTSYMIIKIKVSSWVEQGGLRFQPYAEFQPRVACNRQHNLISL